MFELYKPFRNRLRQKSLIGSLYTVYRFMQFLDFDVELPEGLAPPKALALRDPMRIGLFQWEFEVLARELILNADKHSQRHIATWTDVAKVLNSIKYIENEVWGIHSRHDDDVLYELVRISHRQFPWQRGMTHPHILRYARLYELSGLDRLIVDEYEMSYPEMIQLSLALAGHFLKNYKVRLPLRNEINHVSPDVAARFIDRFSLTLSEARYRYRELQSYDINWAYTFNPLRSKPLLLLGDGTAICPIPSFLIRRVTSEIYFDLVVNSNEFSRSFGPAVQALVGEIARKSDNLGSFEVLGEARYGPKNRRKDTIDWIVTDETATLFVECKSARTRFQGISDLSDQAFIQGEFVRVRNFALQVYKTLADALADKYPHWKPNGRSVYPIIVTLEDWQTFGIHIESLVMKPLRGELHAAGIDPSLIDEHPLSFCAVDTFEQAMSVCNEVGIDTVFRQKSQGEYPQWALETFLMTNFKEQLAKRAKSVFDDQWAKLMPAGYEKRRPPGRRRRG